MKITFLGVGEAFDAERANNSHLLQAGGVNMLVDCGFNVPWQLWKLNDDPNLLDAVYISHMHGDHFAGLPALLLQMWEGGRERELTVVCQKELAEKFNDFMDMVYRGFMQKFAYKINLVKSAHGGTVAFGGLELSFAKTVHSGDNLAVRISDGKSVMVYSGDGEPLPDVDFYKGADLMVLETYKYDEKLIGHSSVVSGIKFAENSGAKRLALTHINRDTRNKDMSRIRKAMRHAKVKVIIPKPFQKINL